MVVILSLLLIGLVLYLFFLKREMRLLTKSVHNIPTTSKYGSRLFNTFYERDLVKLVDELNTMIDTYEAEREQLNVTEQTIQHAITSVSHDLRTPLTAIKGYLQLLQNEQELNPTHLIQIETSVERLIVLTNEFYELAKFTIDSEQMNWQKIEVIQTIETIFLSYYENFEKQGIQVDFPTDCPTYWLITDEQKFQRIIENLIQNILRYGQSTAALHYEEENNHLKISFCNDTDRSTLATNRIFEPFYTDNISRTNQNGSGLGLFYTKKMVAELHGTITASSKENLFCLTLRFESTSD